MNRRILLVAAAFLTAAAIFLAVSGGFRTTVGGLRVSARSPVPIAIVAASLFGLWFVSARRHSAVVADLEATWHSLQRQSRVIVGVAALAMLMAGAFATESVAGADASGYVSEAASLTSGRLFFEDELADVAQGHDPYLTSPLGWRPAPTPGRQSPTYPPGLPALMAVPHAIAGVAGASWVVIASAAVAVIATGLLASQLAGSIAGIIAAAFLAFTPVFIHQAIQPMSDVPVTAAWMVCFALLGRSDTVAGAACAIAVLIRPNLAPLAIVPLWLANRRIAFAAPVATAGVLLAVLQAFWYGSPFRSGYGSAGELFALTNIVLNGSRYFNWLIATTPVMVLSIVGAFRLRSNRLAQGAFLFALAVVASYLVYAVFDDWSYLRFLLPALAIFAVFAGVELAAWIDRWSVAIRPLMMFAIVIGVTAHSVFVARSMGTFRLADQLKRVEAVADFINEDVPPSAVIVAGEQSGSMRYYTDRPILRWEAAAPSSLDTVMAALEKSRRPVYIVLDAWEDTLFRARFSSIPAGALDWPPILDAGTSHRTRLWKLSDRERFQRGDNLSTIRLP